MKLTENEQNILAELAKCPPGEWVQVNPHICASLVRKGLAERYNPKLARLGEPRVGWKQYRATELGREWLKKRAYALWEAAHVD